MTVGTYFHVNLTFIHDDARKVEKRQDETGKKDTKKFFENFTFAELHEPFRLHKRHSTRSKW